MHSATSLLVSDQLHLSNKRMHGIIIARIVYEKIKPNQKCKWRGIVYLMYFCYQLAQLYAQHCKNSRVAKSVSRESLYKKRKVQVPRNKKTRETTALAFFSHKCEQGLEFVIMSSIIAAVGDSTA